MDFYTTIILVFVIAVVVTWAIFWSIKVLAARNVKRFLEEIVRELHDPENPVSKPVLELTAENTRTKIIAQRIGWAKPPALVLMSASNALYVRISEDPVLPDPEKGPERRAFYEKLIDKLVIYEATKIGEDTGVLNKIHEKLETTMNERTKAWHTPRPPVTAEISTESGRS